MFHQRRPHSAHRITIRSDKLTALDGVEDCRQFRVGPIVIPRLVAAGGEFVLDFVGSQTEYEDVVLADRVLDLDVGAIQGADGESAVECELHVPGARSLHPGSGNLFRQIGGGDDLLGEGDPVVRREHDPQAAVDVGIVVDHIGDTVDEPDDEFGHVIGGRRLGAENKASRHNIHLRIGLDPLVQHDDVHDVEQLSLVLVKSFDLDIEERFDVEGDTAEPIELDRKITLVGALYRQELVLKTLVVGKHAKIVQPVEILGPAAADAFGDGDRQPRVAGPQPAPRGDPVGDGQESFRPELGEIPYDASAQQLGVEFCDAVDVF